MNKKNFLAVVGGVSLLLVVVTFNINQSSDQVKLSELALENIMALASGEATEPGNYHIDKQETDYTRDGVVYKQTKVVDCTAGGSSACSPGKYYRYKKDNGEWEEWRPA